MFCSKCGNQLSAELNYCNRCGAAINKTDLETRRNVSGNFSESLGYIGGFGFIAFIFLVLILVKSQVPEKTLTIISLFYLAALFGVCYLIIQQGRNLVGKSEPEKSEPQNFVPLVELPAKDTNQLHEYREPAITVTEETTRNFDKVPRRES